MYARIVFNEQLWVDADARARRQPVYGNSHREEAANQVGCLGEIAAEVWMFENGILFADETHLTTHDYRLFSGKTVDVKTKDRTVLPAPQYECTVPLYNHTHQRPDYFLFVSLRRDRYDRRNTIDRFTEAYIVGSATYELMERKGRHMPKGQREANNMEFWTDCLNINLSEAICPRDTVRLWQTEALSAAKGRRLD